jgi:predicted lipoprotein with Yx(FWY)xxD motif
MIRLALPATAGAVLAFSTIAAFAAAPVTTATTPLGTIYVNEAGMTLYTYDNDTPNTSNCNGNCATNWPPLLAPEGSVPEGDWTIITRSDGTPMWAYESKPVYLWIRDTAPGQTTGDGVGGVWHVIPAQ